MFDLSTAKLIDMAPYIKGEKFIEGVKSYEEINKDYFKVFIDKLEQYEIAKTIFEKVEYYKDFYKYCPDFAIWIPKQQEEIFYAAKCGFILEGAPSHLVYTVKKALEEYPSPNMVPIRLGTTVLNSCFKKGYFKDKITLYDVICNVFGESYQVFDSEHYTCNCSKHTEVYIESEDMVALLPTAFANTVDKSFLRKLVVNGQDLMHEDQHVYLGNLNGYRGVCNSVYDLRELI